MLLLRSLSRPLSINIFPKDYSKSEHITSLELRPISTSSVGKNSGSLTRPNVPIVAKTGRNIRPTRSIHCSLFATPIGTTYIRCSRRVWSLTIPSPSGAKLNQNSRTLWACPLISPLKISTKGVEKLLAELNVKKASGPDNIPCKILRELAAELAPIWQQFFSSL